MKNKKALNILLVATAISGLAQGISMLAIPWYFAKSGLSSKFNFYYAAITFFVLFWGLYAGTIIDKYNRKKVFFILNIICGCILSVSSFYGFNHPEMNFFSVFIVFACTMMNYNVHFPSLYAFGQEITEPKNYGKLNSSLEIVGQSTSFFAGLMGAFMLDGYSHSVNIVFLKYPIDFIISIPQFKIYEIFLFDGLTYFIAALLILFIKYEPVAFIEREKGNILKRVITGILFLKNNKMVLIFGLMSFSIFATVLVEFHAVLPIYINKHLNETGRVFAIGEGAFALGALIAGFLIHKIFSQKKILNAVLFMLLITIIVYMITAYSRSVWIVYFYSMVLGFTNAGTRVLRMTYLFSVVGNEVIGRVSSIFNMINVIERTLLILLFGHTFFSQGSNITYAFIILSGFLFISMLVLFYYYKPIQNQNSHK